MPVNVKLLKKVRKLIAEEPRRLNMMNWGQRFKKADITRWRKTLPPCGTTACLAGWAIFASSPKTMKEVTPRRTLLGVLAHRGEDVELKAAKLIGLPVDECPFGEVSWQAPDVLAWIDRQIDAASK